MELKTVISDYFDVWNDAFRTKNDGHIREFLSEDFQGFWCHSGIIDPEQYSRDYDIVGVLNQYDNAHKSFEFTSLKERKKGEEVIVMGTETNVINNIPFKAQCMFIWRTENSEWKLLREYIELEN